MKVKEADQNDRLGTLCREYYTDLRSTGCVDLQMKKPHLAKAHLARRLKAPQLCRRMKDITSRKKSEKSHKNIFHSPFTEVVVKAETFQPKQRTQSLQHTPTGRSRYTSHSKGVKCRNICGWKDGREPRRRNVNLEKYEGSENHRFKGKAEGTELKLCVNRSNRDEKKDDISVIDQLSTGIRKTFWSRSITKERKLV